MSKSTSSNAFWGIVLILIGVAFLLDSLRVIDFGDLVTTFWPIILILIGVRLMTRNKTPDSTQSSAPVNEQVSNLSDAVVRQTKTFGDVKLKLDSKEFGAASISTVFGDTDIDLTGLDFKDGEKVVSVTGAFGDVTLLVPHNIKATIRANSTIGDIDILGEKDGGFFTNRTVKSNAYDAAKKKLYVSITQVFGDIKVTEGA